MKITEAASTLVLVLCLAACGDDNGTTTPANHPHIANLAVAANQSNVLSAIVTLTATNTDSARVVYWTASEAKQSTPYLQDLSGGRIVALGLRPGTAYNFAVEASNDVADVTSDTVSFTSGALPTFLQSASITSTAPASYGYILTALYDGSTAYATAFDSTGQVAWYRAFPGGKPAAEVKQQTNGAITAMLSTSHGGEQVAGQALAVSPDGTILRTYTAPDGSFLDPHELWELTDTEGAYAGALLFAYTARHLDLSAHGGPADTVITGHQLIKQSAGGAQAVLFDAWDHFAITDNVEPAAGQLDFDHPNSLSIDDDGNYVVSWRNLDLINKIDATTGDVVWTLASSLSAVASDFTFANDPQNGFSAQHSVRVIPGGHLLVFDNGTRHATAVSRVVEYNIANPQFADLVSEFTHAPPYYTQFTGSAQRLTHVGSTLIGWTFGSPLVATEVNLSGHVVWEGTLHATGAQVPYRFTKIRSLYAYEEP